MLSQDNSPIAVSLPPGMADGTLLLRSAVVTEELGAPFCCELDVLSGDDALVFEDLLGQNLTVRLDMVEGGERFFNGYVSECSQGAASEEYAVYQIVLRPWLWLLTRTGDCRIFQTVSALDIVQQVFRDHGFTDFKDQTSGTYRVRDYTVQYRETDFAFVSRLMEEEGIYYFFTHENGKHHMVLADAASSHAPYPKFEEIAFYPPGTPDVVGYHISKWQIRKQIQTGSYAHRAYDFENPKGDLGAASAAPADHAFGSFQRYDYPGRHTVAKDGEADARIRLEELQSGYHRVEGSGTARGIAAGCLFELAEFPRQDQNVEHLMISVRHELHAEVGGSGATGDAPVYQCTFHTMPSSQAFRPPRRTPRPRIHGAQTAVVVGKSGEEIWTDKYGRAKVQFHWDRYGKADENSSCWVRVAQIWAGKKWGGVIIPRIGQEVIVEFLEGDPDRPIITGRVYNAGAMPPYALPDKATVTTLKSNSSKGGQGFNELRFEDEKDNEQVFLHAQKDLDIRVKNDRKEIVENERHAAVVADEFEKTDKSRHTTIVEDVIEKISGNENLTVEGDRLAKVGGGDHLEVGGDQNVAVGGDTNLDTGGDHNHATGTKFSVDAGTEAHVKAATNLAAEGGQNVHIKAGMNVVIEAGLQLTLKVGGNFVVLTPVGVDIQGTLTKINSGGAAGSGAGCSPGSPAAPEAPESPTEPTLPVEAEAGEVSDAKAEAAKKDAATASSTEVATAAGPANPQAQALAQAAEDGTPFCEQCEDAKAGSA